jgi:hypothetical protein
MKRRVLVGVLVGKCCSVLAVQSGVRFSPELPRINALRAQFVNPILCIRGTQAFKLRLFNAKRSQLGELVLSCIAASIIFG